jgi:hypothetical protein
MELVVIQFDGVSLEWDGRLARFSDGRDARPTLPDADSLQRLECATYSAPYYVAEYFHSDPSDDSCDRLRLADTDRADAAAKE